MAHALPGSRPVGYRARCVTRRWEEPPHVRAVTPYSVQLSPEVEAILRALPEPERARVTGALLGELEDSAQWAGLRRYPDDEPGAGRVRLEVAGFEVHVTFDVRARVVRTQGLHRKGGPRGAAGHAGPARPPGRQGR